LFIVGKFIVATRLFRWVLPMPAWKEPSTALELMLYVNRPRFPLLCSDDVLILLIFPHRLHFMSKMHFMHKTKLFLLDDVVQRQWLKIYLTTLAIHNIFVKYNELIFRWGVLNKIILMNLQLCT
jgi:hypothetical protein